MLKPNGIHSLRGFTLIELLVVIIIIATLIGLVISKLSEMKRTSHRLRTLASISSTASIFHMYATDWRDSWPAFMVPGPGSTTVPLGHHDSIEIPAYFMSSFTWTYALADGYYEGNYKHPSMFPSESTAYFGGLGGTPFIYPCTFITDPAYWRSESRTDSRQWRGTYRHEVRFPSQKSLLLSGLSFEYPQALGINYHTSRMNLIPIASVDGSAKARPYASIRPGVRMGDGNELGAVHFIEVFAAAHTVGGVRGRDY